MNEEQKQVLEDLHKLSKMFTEAMDDIRNERENYWNSLSKDEQLKCFCAVVERIMDGENEGHSYRGMLYSVFGFGPEAYAQAQRAGFLGLHNSIFDYNHQRELLLSFAKHAGLENPEEKISSYLKDKM